MRVHAWAWKAELDRYHRDGFLVLEGFVDAATCDRLRARMDELLRGFDVEGVRTVFGGADQRHAQDDWFLDSGDKVRFFFEPDAFDEHGGLRQAKELSINKAGHALHDLDPVFAGFPATGAFAELAAGIGFAQPLLLQSMYIFKQPRIGGEVVCHQDSTFLHTEPLSCVGFWLALEDANETNGCMWAEPGGHRRATPAVRARGARHEDGDTGPLGVAGGRPDPAPGGQGHTDPAARPAAAPQRPQPLGPFPPRLHLAPDRRCPPLQPGQLAAAWPRMPLRGF